MKNELLLHRTNIDSDYRIIISVLNMCSRKSSKLPGSGCNLAIPNYQFGK